MGFIDNDRLGVTTFVHTATDGDGSSNNYEIYCASGSENRQNLFTPDSAALTYQKLPSQHYYSIALNDVLTKVRAVL